MYINSNELVEPVYIVHLYLFMCTYVCVCVWDITKSCNHLRPPTTIYGHPWPSLMSHNFATTTQNLPRPDAILLPPSMPSYIFATTTHNYPQPAIILSPSPMTCHYFTITTSDLELYWKMNSFKVIFWHLCIDK